MVFLAGGGVNGGNTRVHAPHHSTALHREQGSKGSLGPGVRCQLLKPLLAGLWGGDGVTTPMRKGP